jgi:uncharacterized protein
MANPVAWFEILGPDGGNLQKFYTELFGWRIDAANPMNYGMAAAEEGGIPGGIAASQEGDPQITIYIDVPDLQVALADVRRLGGTVVTEPMEVPGGPTLAYFTDPAGNRIGLMKQ